MYQTHKQGRNPFEFLVLGFSIYSGAAQTFSNSVPTNLEESLSPAYRTAWPVILMLAGVIALIGVLIREVSWGLNLEMSGMLALGFGNMAYSFSILATSENPQASYAAPITMALGAACLIRAFLIGRKLYRNRTGHPQAVMDAIVEKLDRDVKREAKQIFQENDDATGGE